ncbi:unnamed protein product, partial [Arabidopsis halleri]
CHVESTANGRAISLSKDQSAEGKVGDVAFPRVNVLLVRNVKS